MYKKIPGSLEYLINSKLEIVDSRNEKAPLLDHLFKTVDIELFGKTKRVCRRWLSLLAWFECGYIDNLEKYLDVIKFTPVVQKNLIGHTGFLMTFTEPIYYKEGFRYIPNFPRYAINTEGVIVDTVTNLIVTAREFSQGYEVAYVYNPDKVANRHIRVHRLLAYAWLPNSDFVARPVINHIDGNRGNNSLVNLEWCSLKENARHAIETGLVGTLIKMQSRDRFTGEIVTYSSAAEMSKKLGMTNVSASNYSSKLPGYLFRGRYEIKRLDDDRPWVHENSEIEYSDCQRSYFTITVLDKKTGISKKYGALKLFYSDYKLGKVPGDISVRIDFLKSTHPNLEISYTRNSVIGPYHIHDLVLKTVTIVNSFTAISEIINRTRTEIQFDLSRNLKFIYSKRWIITLGTNNFDLSLYKEKEKPYRAIVVDYVDGSDQKTFKSLKEAGRYLKINSSTIKKYIENKGIFKGYKFGALD